MRDMRTSVHQFGLVGGPDYDSKLRRFEQILDRLPIDGGSALVFVNSSSEAPATALLERYRRKAVGAQAKATRILKKRSNTLQQVPTPSGGCVINPVMADASASGSEEESIAWICGYCTYHNVNQTSEECMACGKRRHACPEVHIAAGNTPSFDDDSHQVIINFELPSTAEYVRRLSSLVPAKPKNPVPLRVVYTFLTESEKEGPRAKEMCELLRCARQGVETTKATEFDSVLDFFENDEYAEGEEDEEEEEEDEEEEDNGDCDCTYCRSGMLGCTSYHTLIHLDPRRQILGRTSGVEVVRVPLRAMEDMDKAVPFIAPRVLGHVCTVICMHCLFHHTPWDGWEQMFAPPELCGTMRVVLVLAEGVSWHEYHDVGLLCAGGSPWIDILDVESMNRTDQLIEELINHETALLNGHSERIILMGQSQGGGQSMLRFLRSSMRLGGWCGSVTHVPTVPHLPRVCDPLLGGPCVNRDRPVRLLAGELDLVFPPSLALRDCARLRNVGGFTDVEVEVRPGLEHEGLTDGFNKVDSPSPSGKAAKDSTAMKAAQKLRRAYAEVPDLIFLQKHLPKMVSFAVGTEAC